MSKYTTLTFYKFEFQLKLTDGANFCQTAETYLYNWYISTFNWNSARNLKKR